MKFPTGFGEPDLLASLCDLFNAGEAEIVADRQNVVVRLSVGPVTIFAKIWERTPELDARIAVEATLLELVVGCRAVTPQLVRARPGSPTFAVGGPASVRYAGLACEEVPGESAERPLAVDEARRIMESCYDLCGVLRDLTRSINAEASESGLVLLHGDLYLGNVLLEGPRVGVIDFSDWLFGPIEQDVATLLLSLAVVGDVAPEHAIDLHMDCAPVLGLIDSRVLVDRIRQSMSRRCKTARTPELADRYRRLGRSLCSELVLRTGSSDS